MAYIEVEVQGFGPWHTLGLGICFLPSTNPEILPLYKAPPGHSQSYTCSLSFHQYTPPTPTQTHSYTNPYMHDHMLLHRKVRWHVCPSVSFGDPVPSSDAHRCWNHLFFTQASVCLTHPLMAPRCPQDKVGVLVLAFMALNPQLLTPLLPPLRLTPPPPSCQTLMGSEP